MSASPPDTEAVRRALIRRFLTAQVGGHGSPLVAAYPVEAAEVALGVFGPVLDGMAAEITRLQAALAAGEAAGTGRAGEPVGAGAPQLASS